MSNYDFVIHDHRYVAPIWRLMVVTEETNVRDIAEEVLAESTHHHGVEVFEFGVRILGVGSVAKPGRIPRPRRGEHSRSNPRSPKLEPDPRNA